jgi:predicted MFS family arabinose efflux permease
VLLVAFFGLCALSVPLTGGHLGELSRLRLRALWALALAAGLQLAILRIHPGGVGWVHEALHLSSYLLAAWFVVANMRIPGVPLIGLGGALNFLVIAANGGVMPIRPAAFTAAGLASAPHIFQNSAVVASPRLPFLGDVFAVPGPLPFHNVFSAGDICIAIGGAVALHLVCRSRLVPSGKGQFLALGRHRGFMRLWGAQAASNLGDWVYSLAVATSLAKRGGGPEAFALLLVLQVAPSAVVGVLGGPLVDRMPRKRLMIGADVLRGLAVASLLVAGPPSRAHLYGVAFGLGVFGALFQPSFQASLPNLVPRESLVAANALVSTTFHVAVMAGPILGGLLVTHLGAEPAFAVNAASFALSAFLVSGVRFPPVDPATTSESPGRALLDGMRYVATTPLVRWVFVALGLIMLASAIKAPLEPLFILRTLGNKPQALGVVAGVWGVGMVLGSLAAPAAARRWARERLFALCIAAVGVAVLVASQQRLLSAVLLLWFVAGVGNGGGTVFYESLLQERVPDSIRGRVMAASEATLDASFLVGAFAAGVVGTHLGVRAAFAGSGGLFLLAALFTRLTIARPGVSRPVAQAADRPSA